MSMTLPAVESGVQTKTNGAAAAAILSAGVGSILLAALTIISDISSGTKRLLEFYKPSGALSGVSTVTIIAWLFSWIALDLFWRKKPVSLKRINLISLILLLTSVLATFPPFAELFQ